MKWTPHPLPDGHFCVAEDECLSRFMREAGRLDHDQEFLRKICQHTRPGTVVIDGGAFLGDHSIYYAKIAERVIAFEPYRPAYLGLCANVFVGKHYNVYPLPYALSDRWHQVAFGEMPPNVGAISPHEVATMDPFMDVTQALALDDALLDRVGEAPLRRGPIGLIKLDLEGWEMRALTGARETVRKHKPTLVLEVNDGALRALGSSPQELILLVEYLGYKWQPIKGEIGGPCWDMLAWSPDNVYP